VEPRVWGFVSELLADPERLRAGLAKMMARERKALRVDPDREAMLLANELAEVDHERGRFQDMAAEGLIEFDELRARLADLEETRKTARRELAAPEGRRQKLAELERDRDALMESYAGMVPEALKALSPEERHHAYKLLKLRVDLGADDTLKVSGALDPSRNVVCKQETAPASRRR